MHYTYVLKLSNGKLYSGSTSDLVRRQKEHIQGKVKSTRNLRPLSLIFYEAFKDKKDAERREQYLKTDKGKKMLSVMLRECFKN